MKIWLLILILVFVSCAGKKEIKNNTALEELEAAKELFEEKKYDKAIKRLQNVIYKYPGSGLLEDAQYFLSKTYLEKGDYEQAELEYKFFLRNFPNSRFIIKAEYELAITHLRESPPYYLDQTPTEKALRALSTFIEKYPETEIAKEAENSRLKCIDKLVKKELENAKLYIKMGKPKSALLYLEDIEKRYPETTLMPEIEKIKDEL